MTVVARTVAGQLLETGELARRVWGADTPFPPPALRAVSDSPPTLPACSAMDWGRYFEGASGRLAVRASRHRASLDWPVMGPPVRVALSRLDGPQGMARGESSSGSSVGGPRISGQCLVVQAKALGVFQ